MRVKVPRPSRTFLEMDELVALTDAADEQDAPLTRVSRSQPVGAGSRAAQIAERLTAGMRSSEIAAELGLSKATVSCHVRRLGVEGNRDYVGRRPLVQESRARRPVATSSRSPRSCEPSPNAST